MIDEIVSLILDYSNKLADKDFFIKLGNILVKYNNIGKIDYNGVYFLTRKNASERYGLNELSSCLTKGFYNKNDKKIYLITQNLDSPSEREKEQYHLTNKEYKIFINLRKSVHLIHEFEHLVQKKGKPGLEGLLLKDCPSVNSMKTYTLSPREHFANLYPNLITYIIAERLLPKQAVDFFRSSLKYTLINPYMNIHFNVKECHYPNNNPIGEYYILTGQEMPVSKDYIAKMSLLERVIFELPISNAEYDNLDLKELLNPYEIVDILDKYAKEEKFTKSSSKK